MKAELYNPTPKPINNLAIVGGGVASVCLAQQLLDKNPNLNISLICQDEQVARGASGNKQGAVYPHLQGSKSAIAELNAICYQYATEFYKKTLGAGIEFQHQWCGVLQQAFTDELNERYHRVAQTWPDLVQFVDKQKSSELANLELPFPSLWFPNGGWLAPYELCRSLADSLVNDSGIELRLNTRMNAISRINERWQISLSQGSTQLCYDAVVICGGHLSAQFPQTQHLPLEPIRGQVSRLHARSAMAQLQTVLCHKGYITPNQGEYQCFGATFDRHQDSTAPSELDDRRNLEQLKKVYQSQGWSQSLTERDIIDRKAGVRANSPDHLPIVGQVYSDQWISANVDKNNGKMKRLDKIKFKNTLGQPCYQTSELENLYVLTGLGARGLTTAPLMASYLSDLILGLESELPDRLVCAISPKRYQVRALKRNKSVQ